MQKKQLLPKVSELWLHYIWKSGSLLNYDLFSVCRQPIKILFVGWYNKSWGADFKDARILIDQKEYFGDVEIHIDENDWFSHGHHNKQSYNRTILHVFLSKGAKRAFNEIQTEIASLNLGESYLDSFWREKKLPQNICLEELPGACGILLRPEKYPALKNLIFQAAKSRMIKKSESFNSDLNSLHASPEEILFISIFRSLGYNAFVDQFVLMAKIFPYGLLIGFFKDSLRQSRTEILGRWLGFMDFFCKTPPDKINDELRREWQAMRQLWQSIKKTVPQLEFETHAPYRPYNNPLRRLSGFYYHLEKIEFHGLIKSWLKFL
ncbi:MAG: DUF2851 family protein, partial [Deltaproteobacteria bacterium]|nr:DUF2851 family protein [Deltaproteobacteria bacterium]